MTVAVVILAGGEGRRIGGGKPLRLLGGRSLVERALDFARTLAPTVVLSVHEAGQLAEQKVGRILDNAGIEGPLAGIAAALEFAVQMEMDALLTMPCDSPFLPRDLLARLTGTLSGDARVAMASSGGQPHPTCALWEIEALDGLAAYLETGRRSVRGFAEFVGSTKVEWPVEPFDPFFNINSEEDLTRAEKMLRALPSG